MKVRPDLGELHGMLCSSPYALFAALCSFQHLSVRHSAFHYNSTSSLMPSAATLNCSEFRSVKGEEGKLRKCRWQNGML